MDGFSKRRNIPTYFAGYNGKNLSRLRKWTKVKPDYAYSEIWIPVIKKNDRWLFEKTWMEFYREFRNR